MKKEYYEDVWGVFWVPEVVPGSSRGFLTASGERYEKVEDISQETLREKGFHPTNWRNGFLVWKKFELTDAQMKWLNFFEERGYKDLITKKSNKDDVWAYLDFDQNLVIYFYDYRFFVSRWANSMMKIASIYSNKEPSSQVASFHLSGHEVDFVSREPVKIIKLCLALKRLGIAFKGEQFRDVVVETISYCSREMSNLKKSLGLIRGSFDNEVLEDFANLYNESESITREICENIENLLNGHE